jgi:splicing factor 3B subunit 3
MEMDDGSDEEEEDEEEKMAKKTTVRGPVPASAGSWGSCIRLIDPSSTSTLDVVELGEGEAALSCCAVQFSSRPGVSGRGGGGR